MKVSINSDLGASLGIHAFGNNDGLLNVIDTADAIDVARAVRQVVDSH